MTQPIYGVEQLERSRARRGGAWPSGLPGPGAARRPAAAHARHAEFLHNEVPGITIPDEARAAMHAAGERGAEVGLEMAPALLEQVERLVAGHLHHAQLRPLRAGRRAGPPDPDATSRPARRPPRDGWRLDETRRASSRAVRWLAHRERRAAGARRAGPPFPDPVDGRAVYDYAGILRPDTIAHAEATIDAIEARTGAEVVVYTQVVDYGSRPRRPKPTRGALIDQWGVGRKGFDDGLVILFDLDPTSSTARSSCTAAPGYRAAFLDEQRATGDLRERHAAAAAAGRPRRRAPGGARRRSTRPRRRSTRPSSRQPARSTPRSAWSSLRSCSWSWSAARSSRGGATARTRSTSTIRRSTCRPRRPT